jgi:uncharacterized membrane protein
MKRIGSIDIVRGLVMILMALDHTRDFMHISSLTQNPLDLATTTPELFLTRWITHFCAPIFVFLAGTSAFLSMRARNNPEESRRFLLTRGLWLILLEFTLVNFALWFDIRFRILLFEVIAALGFGFILLSLLMKVPAWLLAVTGLILISGHDLFANIHFNDSSVLKAILSPLLSFTSYQVSPHFTFVIAYPPLDWFGIMVTGFAAGRLFELAEPERKKIFLSIGAGMLALFIFLRLVNSYGEPYHWSSGKSFIFTILSFLNVSKYPPSLLFTLMTLGVMFLALYESEGSKGRIAAIFKVYGKVPLFYFIIHLYIIHGIMILIMFLQGFTFSEMSFEPFRYGRAAGSGISLGLVYLVWLGVVAILFPVCSWYGNYKSAHKNNTLLRYL